MTDFQLKFCFIPDSEILNAKIQNIIMSKKLKFFAIILSNYNIEIFNLGQQKSVGDNKCQCSELYYNNNLEETSKKNFSFKQKAKGFIFGAFSKLKNIFYEENTKSFCKYKFTPYKNENKIMNKIRKLNVYIGDSNEEILVNFDKINELVRIYL